MTGGNFLGGDTLAKPFHSGSPSKSPNFKPHLYQDHQNEQKKSHMIPNAMASPAEFRNPVLELASFWHRNLIINVQLKNMGEIHYREHNGKETDSKFLGGDTLDKLFHFESPVKFSKNEQLSTKRGPSKDQRKGEKVTCVNHTKKFGGR